MTLIKPTIQEYAGVHMRVLRNAFSAFLPGPGLVSATDYQVSGDPTAMVLNIGDGCAFLQMPGKRSGYEPLVSDDIERRSIATAPVAGIRTDLVYLGIFDKEYGDDVNDWDIYVKTNPIVGTGKPPAADAMASTYALGTLDVPAGVTKGSLCTFRKTAQTTAPMRQGGYTQADVNFPQGPVYTGSDTIAFWNSDGSTVRGHGASFKPRMIQVVVRGTPLNKYFTVDARVHPETITDTGFKWTLVTPNGPWPGGNTGPVYADYYCWP